MQALKHDIITWNISLFVIGKDDDIDSFVKYMKVLPKTLEHITNKIIELNLYACAVTYDISKNNNYFSNMSQATRVNDFLFIHYNTADAFEILIGEHLCSIPDFIEVSLLSDPEKSKLIFNNKQIDDLKKNSKWTRLFE